MVVDLPNVWGYTTSTDQFQQQADKREHFTDVRWNVRLIFLKGGISINKGTPKRFWTVKISLIAPSNELCTNESERMQAHSLKGSAQRKNNSLWVADNS